MRLIEEVYNDVPHLFTVPPIDRKHEDEDLENTTWMFIKCNALSKNSNTLQREDSLAKRAANQTTEEQEPTHGPVVKRHKSNQNELEEFPDEQGAKHSSEPYGEYQGKGERVGVLRWDLTRNLTHFFLSMNKGIPTVVRETFNTSTRKSREPSALETECLTFSYTLHAFLVKVPDLDEFLKRPYAIGLQYAMRRLYVLLKLKTEVPPLFATRHQAWIQYKVLLDDYTSISIAQSDNVKEDVSKVIGLQLKMCGDNTTWRDINTKTDPAEANRKQ